MVLDDVLEVGGVEDEDADELAAFEDRDAEALAAEHEPDDAEFPVLEAVDLGVRAGVEVNEGAGGDEVLAGAVADGEAEGDVGD